MICPHCGHQNLEQRRFCRNCAKPLTAPASSPPVASSPSPAAAPPTPTLNRMAVASFGLSFLAFLLPFGIASVVMGHLSRSQIQKSEGRQTGMPVAFAGLVISYLQIAVMVLLGMGLISFWRSLNRAMDRDPYARAAIVEQLKLGGRPNASMVERQRQHAVDALRLIHASEMDYIAAHPDEGFACDLTKLGWDPASGNELNLHMISSRYEIKIYQCRGMNDQRYAVVAIPESRYNPPNSPVYCVDQTGVVRRTDPDFVSDIVRVLITERRSCPESGEPVAER